MTKNIVFQRKEGGVSIMTLVQGADRDDAVKKFLAAHVGEYYADYLEDVEVPADRTHRDAWTIVSNKIVVDKKKI